MIRYFSNQSLLQQNSSQLPNLLNTDEIIWIELCAPTADETENAARYMQLGPIEEMVNLAAKQPNWHDSHKDLFIFGIPLAAIQPGRLNEDRVTFILTSRTLLTIHNLGFDLFADFSAENRSSPHKRCTCEDLLIDLLDYLLLHLSQKAEEINAAINELSRKVFAEPKTQWRYWRKSINFRTALRNIGRIGSVSNILNDNLRWLERVPLFLHAEAKNRFSGARRTRLDGIRQDVINLIESVAFIQQQTALVLDATLGIINLEESFVMRWLTVIATIFIPPTFIASVYGMNFTEFSTFGGRAALPIALLLVVISGALPFLFFVRKGWL